MLTPTPTIPQVLEWTSLVLDAHMAQLLLVPDTRRALVDLKELVSKATALCESMQELQSFVALLSTKGPLPVNHTTSVYQVEVIHL